MPVLGVVFDARMRFRASRRVRGALMARGIRCERGAFRLREYVFTTGAIFALGVRHKIAFRRLLRHAWRAGGEEGYGGNAGEFRLRVNALGIAFDAMRSFGASCGVRGSLGMRGVVGTRRVLSAGLSRLMQGCVLGSLTAGGLFCVRSLRARGRCAEECGGTSSLGFCGGRLGRRSGGASKKWAFV